MHYDVFMAGFGGQGVLLIGNLLAYAAIREGMNASYFPAYGVEKRGGAATCTVVISDEEVGSPVIGRPGVALILNPLSMEKYFDKVRPGGFCLVNTSLVEDFGERGRSDIDVLGMPLTEMALEAGDARLLNMVALGACMAQNPVVSLATLKAALTDVLPERNHRFIPLNSKAIDMGAEFVRDARREGVKEEGNRCFQPSWPCAFAPSASLPTDHTAYSNMTRIEFIRLKKQEKAKHLCDLAEEFFQAGKRVLVTVLDENQGVTLDRFMWIWRKGSFLPHALDNGAVDCLDDPVVIGTCERNPNGARILIMGKPCHPEFISQFELAIDFAELYDSELADASRRRFVHYREAGFEPCMRK